MTQHIKPTTESRRVAGFERLELDDTVCILHGSLPLPLQLGDRAFDALWSLHPRTSPNIRILGRDVTVPRYQQAYGRDYAFSGQTSTAKPVPDLLQPYLGWVQSEISPAYNGLLVNWYDADKKHYIGKHRDSTKDLLEGVPIAMLSFGASRIMRLRPHKRRSNAAGYVDVPVENGAVILLPRETNDTWTHEVLHRASNRGRRISVTLRAFEPER